jgi:hypothetical protein
VSFKDGAKTGELVSVGLTTVRREPPPPEPVLPEPPETQPTQEAQKATVEQTGADPPPEIASLRLEVASLRANVVRLSAQITRCQDWIDVVSSPLLKRLWFVLRGYRWKRLGTRTDTPWPPPTPGWWRS